MKITSLACPSCGGSLKPQEGNPQIMVCEYCNSQFVIENDMPVNYHIHQYPGYQKPTIREVPSSPIPIAVFTVFCLIFIIIVHIIAARNLHRNDADYTSSYPASGYEEPERTAESSETGHSPLYEAFLEAVFEKDADLVTEAELAQIKYISVHTGSEFSYMDYSFQSPYEEDAFEPVTLRLDPLSWDSRDLSFFTGLQRADLSEEHLSGISFEKLSQLKGLICRGMTPEEIAQLIPEPEQILELSLIRPESLDGIAVFTQLETLSLERIPAPDIRQLVSLKELRSLSITEEETDDSLSLSEQEPAGLTDYSALSVLTGLEHLELSSSSIREFSFLKSLTGLTSLAVSDSEAISLEPLTELTQLTSLELKDNSALQDYAPLETLVNLRTLVLDKGTSQPDPDLSSLSLLEDLDMSGFMSISFLGRMTNLRHLSLHSCNADEIQSLSGLTGLESLTCYSIWTYAVPLRDLHFLDSMTNLKTLDLSGGNMDSGFSFYQYCVEVLGDISNAFNHPGLERLILNYCTFGIDFDRIQENPTLTHLEMKEVSLKENFYVESYNGITDVWYDDVALNDHISFLTSYPNLEELYLDGNQLTDLQFASSLKQLRCLGVQNNYITELSPLNQAERLEYLDIRTNPVSKTDGMGEDITILK